MINKLLSSAGLSIWLLLASPVLSPAKTYQIEAHGGVVVKMDAGSGHYSVGSTLLGWKFGGGLGAPATNVKINRGADKIDAYQEISFSWQTNENLLGSIRIYDNRPAAMFRLTTQTAAKMMTVKFPDFSDLPKDLHHFSFQDLAFSRPAFDLETNGTPWLLFDDSANAAILSAADQFMIASMAGDGVHEMANALNPGVVDLPAGFSYATLLTFGKGIHDTWKTWGNTLLALSGKVLPANDADIGLRYLGYWTDHGAYYYYNYDTNLGYAGTLEKLVKYYRDRQIPIRYLQLDSWWYYKSFNKFDGTVGNTKNSKLPAGDWNRYGGLMKYEADPAILPDGLAGLHNRIHLPLITHNRWIDQTSPYHKKYRISGVAAVDSNWWGDIIGHIAAGGVVCYEQDWLNDIYWFSPELQTNPGLGDAFTDGMAQAARQHGLSLQYCMPLPRFFMQGSRYANLTTIRTSGDRFNRKRWDNFIYVSQLADAVGIWPWTDVFMSSETNNLLISVLSAGMVGTGDAIGKEDKNNLMQVARPDGVLVKPDVSLLPLDEVYLAQANGTKGPMVAWTHSDHGTLRTAYIFAYNRQNGNAVAEYTPTKFGLAGEVCVFNTRTGQAEFQSARKQVKVPLEKNGTAYYLIAPIGKSGLAFFGDEGKFVSCGHQRIAALDDESGALTATVTFAKGEKSVRLFGYAKHAPKAVAQLGSTGNLQFDAKTGRFSIEVMPSAEVSDTGPDPVQTAKIVFATK